MKHVQKRSGGGWLGRAAAVTIHDKDELTLAYRLETPDGKALVEEKDKRKAEQDGEDLLTPMVEKAAEKIVAAAKGETR
jgi:porphobilinogen deaminase